MSPINPDPHLLKVITASFRAQETLKRKRRRQYSIPYLDTCLYIGNIDKRLSQEKLNSVFAEYGELDYCYIVYEPYSAYERSSKNEPKQSRGYGFAKYKKP